MTHEQIRLMLNQYQREIGAGRMVPAAKTLGQIVGLLSDKLLADGLIESGRDPVPAKPVETKFTIEVGGLPQEEAKKVVEQQLAKVVDAHAAAAQASTPPVTEGAVCAPCDVTQPDNPALIEDFKKTVVDEEAGTVTRNGITEPVIEHTTQETPANVDPVAPAPKTPKKSKDST